MLPEGFFTAGVGVEPGEDVPAAGDAAGEAAGVEQEDWSSVPTIMTANAKNPIRERIFARPPSLFCMP
ncbi:MAG: hypothetical protein Q7O66_00955 [Dehalococcoidia bacterium]|nr:hypothetical protein [Dehalococcoidia bacterium]